MKSKFQKLMQLFNKGKTLSCEKEWISPNGENGTLMISMWNDQQKVKYRVEKYLNKHAFSEDLYLIDELNSVNSIDEFINVLSDFDINILDFHG